MDSLLDCPIAPPGGWGNQKPQPGVPVDWSHPLASDLAAMWLFNDGSGTLANDAIQNANGIIRGCQWTPTNRGQSLRFNGTSDYVAIPNIRESRATLTVCCWFRSTTSPQNNKFIFCHFAGGDANHRMWAIRSSDTSWTGSNGNELTIYVSPNGASTNKTYWVAGVNIMDGTWHHLAFTFDAGRLTPYLDGVYRTPTKVSDMEFSTLFDCPAPMTVGGWLSTTLYTPGGFVSGDIDMPIVWNRVLSSAEISELYYAPYSMFASGGGFVGDVPSRRRAILMGA